MSNRAARRAAERLARETGRQSTGNASVLPITESAAIPEPGEPFPSLAAISPARLAANRANAQLSAGPTSRAGLAISSQNRTTHGLARHNGTFQILPIEDAAGFEALKQSLTKEHQPATETESILVAILAESHWLVNRAQRLQDKCFDPATGEIADPKLFNLYLRYQATHRRAFHTALHDLLKLKAEKRTAEFGFEAQRVKAERHEMKKQTHYWDVLCKDAQACHQIGVNSLQHLAAAEGHPGFEAQYAADLTAHGLKPGNFEVAITPKAA